MKKRTKLDNTRNIPMNYNDIISIRKSLSDIVLNTIDNFVLKNKLTYITNIDSAYFDPFTLDTDILAETTNTLYITQYITLSSLIAIPPITRKKKRASATLMSMQDITNGVFNDLVKQFDKTTALIKKTSSIQIELSDSGQHCILTIILGTKTNAGIEYYTNGYQTKVVENINLYINNFATKDDSTQNLMSYHLRKIKSILSATTTNAIISNPLIEILAYNVPVDLYNSDSDDNTLQIINYIINNSYETIKLMDDKTNIKSKMACVEYNSIIHEIIKAFKTA